MTHVYLNVEQVMAIHQDQIEQFGGSLGILNKGALESSLARPQSGYYNDIVGEAAALLESLATNHPFVDGNKRVAFVATDIFLRLNGYFIDCDSDEADQFIRRILVDGSNRFSEIQAWLRVNKKPLPSNR